MNRIEQFKIQHEEAIKLNNEYKYLKDNKIDVKYGVVEALNQFEKQYNEETLKHAKEKADKELKLKEKQQKLQDNIKKIDPQKMTDLVIKAINKKKEQLKKDQEEIDNINEIIVTREKEFSSKRIEKRTALENARATSEEAVRDKYRESSKALGKLKEGLPKFEYKDVKDVLIYFLKQNEGKTFTEFVDKSAYENSYIRDREEYYSDVYFHGIKCTSKVYKTVDQLKEGIKRKEVIVFNALEDRSWSNSPKDFSYEINRNFNLFKTGTSFGAERQFGNYIGSGYMGKSIAIPNFSLFTSSGEYDYFKIYPKLQQELVEFVGNRYFKQEEKTLQHYKSSIEGCQMMIDSNNERFEKEVKKLRKKFDEELVADKLRLNEHKENYKKQKEHVDTLKVNKITKPNNVEEDELTA